MLFIYIFLTLIFIFIAYMSIETRMVETKHVKFTKNKNHLKIIQLSDIHIYFLKVPIKKIVSIIKHEKPDLIILTGDYIRKPEHIPAFFKFLELIGENNKVVACLGNHEQKAFLNNYAGLKEFIGGMGKLGVQVLQDTSLLFEKNQKKYNIIGIRDINDRNHSVENALKSISAEASSNIAISHNPDIIFEIPHGKVDYLFSGHFHGGQIWEPFGIESRYMRKERLCKLGIIHGLHKIKGVQLYINRGLGNVTVPLRFLSRPEITVFYLP